MTEGTGAVPGTNGSGSKRPKNTRIWIRNTALATKKPLQFKFSEDFKIAGGNACPYPSISNFLLQNVKPRMFLIKFTGVFSYEIFKSGK
jgi:hypothetical protein